MATMSKSFVIRIQEKVSFNSGCSGAALVGSLYCGPIAWDCSRINARPGDVAVRRWHHEFLWDL